MKKVLRVLLFVPLILFLSGCNKELQQAAEDSATPRTRAGVPEGAYYLMFGRSPIPPETPGGTDMQLCLSKPLSRDLGVQLSVCPKNGSVIGSEWGGTRYLIRANQRYINISLPKDYKQTKDSIAGMYPRREYIPLIATIKYLIYSGPEELWYSTVKYQLTYDMYGPYVTCLQISGGTFVDFRNPAPPVTPDPNPGEIRPIRPTDPGMPGC